MASEEMEIKLVKLEGDQKTNSDITGPIGPCLSVAICPKSKYIAASSTDGNLYIWEIENSSLVKEISSCFPKTNSFQNADVLCKIDFEPVDGKKLAYPNEASIIVLNTSDWSEYAVLTSDKITDSFSIVRFSPCGKYLAAVSIKGEFVIWDVAHEIVNNYTKCASEAQVSAFAWNPSGLNQIVYTDKDGQLGVLSDCIEKHESNEQIEENDNDVDFGDVQFDDDDEDNENAISLEKLKKEYTDDVESELKSLASRSPTPRPRTPLVPLQEPFMPSSTPITLDPRYLCWNEVGIVRSYGHALGEDDDSSRSIETDFHDTMFQGSMMMQNYQNYTMASLSLSVLVVGNVSEVKVIPLAFRNKEWTLGMEPTEEIVCIAASENLVCIALSDYKIRVCSSFGTQRAVFSAPGPIVSMSAFKDDILIAYHCSPVRDDDQCISFKLIRLEGMNIQGQDLGTTLGPKSRLQWLGFSDSGTPSAMDSLGMLHMYPLSCNTWIPFCDTTKHRKGMSDGFFITAIFESNQTLCGIKCRGTIYPTIIPRPTMCEVPLDAPFAEMSTEKSQMESNLFTWSILKIPNNEKKFKETALKTFALACKTNLDQRAQEVMEILSNSQILSLAIKYATRLERKRLAEKLTELAARLSSEEDNEDVHDVPPVVVKPKRLTLPKTTKVTEYLNNLPASQINELPEGVEPLTDSIAMNYSMDTTTNSEDLIFSPNVPKNPFLKSLKNTKTTEQNPLSLIDSKAGINFVDPKEKKSEVAEKRKQPESGTENQKPKQRKLDRFMFGKR